jgi:hypothetical protein
MPLTRPVFITAGLWLVLGLGAGVLAQAELWAPGFTAQTDAGVQAAKMNFNIFADAHRCLFAYSLPIIVVIGLPLALALEYALPQQNRISLAIMLAICIASAVPLMLGAHFAALNDDIFIHTALLTSIVSATALFAVHPARNWSGLILIVSAILPMLMYIIYRRVQAHVGIDHALHDTYYDLARLHIAGVAITLLSFSILTIWAKSRRAVLNPMITLVIAVPLLASGVALAFVQSALGLNGMPLKYADYPNAFAEGQRNASTLSFILAAFIVIFLIRLAVAYHRRDRSTPADAF